MPRKRALDHDASDSSSIRPPPRLRAPSPPSFLNEATKMELDAVRAELEHERSLRALYERRAQQTKAGLQQRLELALQEVKETKAVLDATQADSENHIQQLRENMNDAFRQLRETQAASLDSQRERLLYEQQVAVAEETRRSLESQLSMVTEHVEVLKHELEVERSRESKDDKQTQQPYEPNAPGSLAPTPVLKELNRTRIQLAESERKSRQLERKSEELRKRSKAYAEQQEELRVSSSRISKLEMQLQNEARDVETLRAENSSWRAFSKTLDEALVGTNASTSEDASALTNAEADLPTETSRVLRILAERKKENEGFVKEKERVEKALETSQARVLSLDSEIERTKSALSHSKTEIKQVQKHLDDKSFDLQAMKAQEGIWKREAESLRKLLKTYDEDSIAADQPEQSPKPGTALRELHATFSKAKEEVELLIEERGRVREQLESMESQYVELKSQYDQVIEKYGKLKNALFCEKQKVHDAEERAEAAETLGVKGHFNEERTRILHLTENPLAEAVKQKYEARISELSKQLEAAGETPGQASSTAPEVDPQKLHQRLKQSFKEQIGLFREGVYLMTGYKVDMLPNTDRPTFRVRSVYAEHEHDHMLLVWPQTENPDSLDVVETEQARVLAKTDSYAYMTKYKSLPAFLASVQLNLFEKQTML